MTVDRVDPAWFEDLYRREPDPWDFATRRFARGLDAGCSIGVFTEALAPRCDELLALDASATAVAAARARLRDLPHVRVERRTLPEELPAGRFDLVVCSEILYYMSEHLLRDLLASLEASLAPGGSLVAVHWRPPTRTYPLRGDDVHRILADALGLDHGFSEQAPEYLIDRYDRPR
jgi:SAM-dependent methyltransferase